MQLRFIIFYKIISLRSVPHNQARPTANPPSPINYFALYSEAGSLPRLKLRTAYAFYRLGHLPSFHSGIYPTAVINYFALYSEAGSLPRLKLRTAYAFFLTIRRSGFSSEEDPPLYGSAFQASPTRGAAERAESRGAKNRRRQAQRATGGVL